jgi:hypothetical protein
VFPDYQGASVDGSNVLFTSCEQLTNDSTAGFSAGLRPPGAGTGGACLSAADHVRLGVDLYQYDTSSGQLHDLTVDSNPGDPNRADVQGVVGESADGSYVYFVANGVLAAGASPGNCSNLGITPPATCSLYVRHGGVTTFIATLEGNTTNNGSSVGDQLDWRGGFGTARVSADGTHVAFMSVRSLTGYDNTIAGGGSTCGVDPVRATPYGDPHCPEVFIYDATAGPAGQLSCASCNPSGARPTGPSLLHAAVKDDIVNQSTGFESYLPRNLSADGSRLFFESVDALVPQDINGVQDVYEYENGQARLISNGTGAGDSVFLDASVSGDNVFFATQAQLVGQDGDNSFDVYDARIGGGYPPPSVPSVACQGDACQGPVAAPNHPTPNSLSFSGPGNPAPAHTGAVKPRGLTRAQKLAGALKACKRKPKRKRAACVARAHRRYGVPNGSRRGKKAKRSITRSDRGGSR